MKSLLWKAIVGVLAVAAVTVFALVRPDESGAIASPQSYPPLHAGIGSPGSVILEGEQHENPPFFAIVRSDWLTLGIEEPRTAWEFVQRGIHFQDDLEDEEAARLDYEHALELLEHIAEETGDITLPERLLQAHFRLGPIYLHRHEYELAIEHFEVILAENPEAEGPNLEIALAFEGLAEEALHEGDLVHAQEYFQEAWGHFVLEENNAPNSQLLLYDIGEFLLLPEVPDLFEVVQVDPTHVELVRDENGDPVLLDKEARALDALQRYLARAVEHCDTYPFRILEADKKARELGGPGNALALRNCVIERERIL